VKILLNIGTLILWQGSIYLIPLLTTPYLARVLGVTHFGILAIAGAIVSYVSLVCEWGFSLSATQKAAQNASSPAVLRTLFWDVTMAKALLALVAILGAGAIIWMMPSLHAMTPILLAYLLQVLFSIANAGWLLQGLERMVGFATASLLGRALTVPLTFLLVHSPDDVVIAAAIQGGTFLVSTVASLYFVARVIPLRPVGLSLSGAWRQIREGTQLFLSTGGISLYSQSNLVVLAALSGVGQAGLFSGADRIRRGVQGVIGPISMGIFPRVNNLLASSPERAGQLMKIVLAGQAAATLMLSLAMYVSAEFITTSFLGPDFAAAVIIVKLLSPIPFIVGLSNALGINIMLPHGMTRQFMQITVASGLINLAMLVPLCHFYGGAGAAAAVTMTEALVTAMMATVVYHRRKSLFVALPAAAPA